MNFYKCNKKSAPSINVQSSKTVTAGTSQQTVAPDTGYDAMGEVVVNPTPSQSKSVTATTSAQTVVPDSGKLLSQITVNPQIHSQTMNYSSNGTKDLGANNNVRYVNIDVPSSRLTETTLWTNPAQTSAFAAQTVTLSQSITNFTYIKIVADTTATEGTDTVCMMKVSEFLTTSETGNNIPRGALSATGRDGTLFARTFWYVSGTQVGFGRGITQATGATNNAAIIPINIIGLR